MRLSSWKASRIVTFVLQACVLIWISCLWSAQTLAQLRPPDLVPVPEERKPPRTSEGYRLTIFTISQAQVFLTRLSPPRSTRTRPADEQGIGVFDKLPPGAYELRIERTDYEAVKKTIRIGPGQPSAYNGVPSAKFGAIILGMGEQAAPDVEVWLGANKVDASRLEIREGKIYVRRVPVTKRVEEIRLSKPGYESWSQQRVIQPGECDNFVPVKLNRSAIALTIKSLPTAEVYLGNKMKGRVTEQGTLQIDDLDPGPYKLKVVLQGYEIFERELTLALDNRTPITEAMLVPIAEDEEVDGASSPESKWTPAVPPDWKFTRNSVQVAGETVALLSRTNVLARRFNVYKNFLLVFDVKFENGRGAAWIVRAQDERNYYLFELTTARSTTKEKYLNFYVCRDGNCQSRGGYPVTAAIEQGGESIRIYLCARGNTFRHFVETSQDGRVELAPSITDSTFPPYGGVGLRAINGLEMFVSQFLVTKDDQQAAKVCGPVKQ